jgi:hypothetical protein
MQDLLYVSFDKNPKTGETGICVGRVINKDEHKILTMYLDHDAEVLYKLLTEQGALREVQHDLA